MLIKRLAIIGVGLIGGSLARALRRAGAVGEIVGSGRDASQLEKAVELGVIDRYELDPALAVRKADVVVLAVPLGSMEGVMRAIAPTVAPGAVVTDVGSAKASVIAAAGRAFGAVPPRFVPGHPIAGTEKSGVEASLTGLFEQRRVILTPGPETDPIALATVRSMWQETGAQVVEMDAAHHDEILAATSHLPHLLAFTLVDTLAQMEDKLDIFRYAAGGFRDFTRIASSDPQMWHDICLANREAILAMIDRYAADLSQLGAAIRAGDGEVILARFVRAKQARDRYCEFTSDK